MYLVITVSVVADKKKLYIVLFHLKHKETFRIEYVVCIDRHIESKESKKVFRNKKLFSYNSVEHF